MNLRFLTASIVFIAFSFSTSHAVAKTTARVAVLPLEIYSDGSPDYLRDTISKELSLQMSAEEQISVVDQKAVKDLLDRKASFNFNEFTLRKISEELQAHFLVFGSLTKINNNLSLDVYLFDSLGDSPFTKDFVEGNELNYLIRAMARKVSTKVLLLASKHPELQEPKVVAKVKPVSPSVKVEEKEKGKGKLLPGAQVAEGTLVEEVKEAKAGGEEGRKVEVAMLPRTEVKEVEEQPKDIPKKKSTPSPFASDEPVKITSNTLEADNKRNKVTFKGNVIARQGDMVIFSDLMTVKYKAKGGIGKIEASGNVKMTQSDRIATGKKIVFNNSEQKIVMTGNPRIWQDDNLISCRKVTVLLKEDKIFFEGDVDSTIYPKGIKEGGKSTKRVEALATPAKPKAKEVMAEGEEKPASEEGLSSENIQKAEEETIRIFVLDWKHYWENKDLEKYMGCYSKEFTSRGMGWNQWKKYKRHLNNRYHQISLSFDALSITLKDDKTTVNFKQHYQSDNYSDYGTKSLLLKKEDGQWKIFSEQWEPL